MTFAARSGTRRAARKELAENERRRVPVWKNPRTSPTAGRELARWQTNTRLYRAYLLKQLRHIYQLPPPPRVACSEAG